jgi:hypothetical protein
MLIHNLHVATPLRSGTHALLLRASLIKHNCAARQASGGGGGGGGGGSRNLMGMGGYGGDMMMMGGMGIMGIATSEP